MKDSHLFILRSREPPTMNNDVRLDEKEKYKININISVIRLLSQQNRNRKIVEMK